MKWVERARALAWFSVCYNLLEAAASGAFGLKEGSLSLLGFGGDSLIEAASAAVVLWRFREVVEEGLEDAKERRAQKLIGVLLLALALYLTLSSSLALLHGRGPAEATAGIVIALVSLAVMWRLYGAKKAVAEALHSKALRADAFCTLSCMWLSGLLLLGSLLLAGTHLIIFDGVTSLGMAYLIAKEGAEEYDDSCDCADHDHA